MCLHKIWQGVTPCRQIGDYQSHGQDAQCSPYFANLYLKDGNGFMVDQRKSKRPIVHHPYGLNSGKLFLPNKKNKLYENGHCKNPNWKQPKPQEVSKACPPMTMSTSRSSTQPELDLHKANLQQCYAYNTHVVRQGVTPALVRGG